MFRWSGSQKDSDQQASDRNSRAARRTIAGQTVPTPLSDEEEFQDCDTSLLFSTDGANDDAESTSSETPDMSAAEELARQRALPVAESNFANDPESWKKEIKLKFDQNNVTYWFNSVESQMKKYGINMQWDKKDAIVPLLPEQILEEVMPILRLTEDEAGPHIYKDLKAEIITLYGPREEDAFKKAIALRMTGTPSAFGKKLIHILCPGAKPFSGCHCAKIVYGFWEAQLSPPIKSSLAGVKFNQDTYLSLFQKADQVYLANAGTGGREARAVSLIPFAILAYIT